VRPVRGVTSSSVAAAKRCTTRHSLRAGLLPRAPSGSTARRAAIEPPAGPIAASIGNASSATTPCTSAR